MTRHKYAHTGLGTPSPLDRWIDAMLRVFAMLVQSVASTFQMRARRLPVIGTRTMPDALPRVTSDTQQQEPQTVAASDTPIMHPTPACHPGSAKRYPGPIHTVGRTSQWLPALRFAAAGMTTIVPFEAVQPARSINSATPSLRSSRRTPGPRASRVLRVTGLRKQPWIPAYAGMSGFLNPPNKNAAA